MYRVSVSNLVVTRSGYPALAHANFQLNPVFCAIAVGANGSGKTTLLQAISGLVYPERGNVVIGASRDAVGDAGDDSSSVDIVEDFFSTRQLRKIVSYIGHSPLYMRHVTVDEHIKLCRKFDRNPDAITAQQMSLILEKFGLETRRNVKVEDLSAGQQRRLHIASAYLRTNPILCIDEPHASLDEKSKKLVDETILDLKSQSRSTIIATHDPERLMKMATHLIELKDGQATLKSLSGEGSNGS